MSKSKTLWFTPYAWAKLVYYLKEADTEVGGYGLTSSDDLLYVYDFNLILQESSVTTCEFDNVGLADYQCDMAEQGIAPEECMRIWIHTHPGQSPHPSGTDEDTCKQVFGKTSWGVMCIVSESLHTYARLVFSAGPGMGVEIPVAIDWKAPVEAPNYDECAADLEEYVTKKVYTFKPTKSRWDGWDKRLPQQYPEATDTEASQPSICADTGLPVETVKLVELAMRNTFGVINPNRGTSEWWSDAALVWEDVFGYDLILDGVDDDQAADTPDLSVVEDLPVFLDPFDSLDVDAFETWAAEKGLDLGDCHTKQWWDLWEQYVSNNNAISTEFSSPAWEV